MKRARPVHEAPRVALFSPRPPDRSGIADYVARLLPTLEGIAELDWIVDRALPAATDSLGRPIGRLEYEWNESRGLYATRLFHVGNSAFHARMLRPLFRHGGAVALHEVRLDGLAGWITATTPGGIARFCADALPASVVDAIRPQLAASGFPAASSAHLLLRAIANAADSILVHSRHAESLLRDSVVGIDVPIVVSPLGAPRFALTDATSRGAIRARLGISDDEIVFGAFGHLQPDKGIDAMVRAVRASGLAKARVLLVGAVVPGHEAWLDDLVATRDSTPVTSTGPIASEAFLDCMRATDVGVVLRRTLRGESSAVLTELLALGVATVVTDGGSFAELPRDAVVHASSDEPRVLAELFHHLGSDPSVRSRVAANAREFASTIAVDALGSDYRRLLGIARPSGA